MGWRLLFWYINVYSKCCMNTPFSHFKFALVALCYFCEATVLQINNPHKKCPVTLHITDAHCSNSCHPPLLLTPQRPFFSSSSLTGPAPPSRRAERSVQEGEAEPSEADNWIGVEAQLPAAVAAAATAASSGKLPAPPPTSLGHTHKTHTEPLIGRDCCRHCFTNHAIER